MEGFPAAHPDHLLRLQPPNEDHAVLRSAAARMGSQKFTSFARTAYSKLIAL